MLETVSNIISIFSPLILLIWFYYSQKQSLSKNYYLEIAGKYAGRTTTIDTGNEDYSFSAGIIMIIREVNNSGYFKGEFYFLQKQYQRSKYENHINRESTNPFYGILDFKIYKNKLRHPFKHTQNRVYKGKLYVTRILNIKFEKYEIEDYVSYEYSITHYREMQVLRFDQIAKYDKEYAELPQTFTLYKSGNFDFEPYSDLKETIFKGTKYQV